MLFDKNILSHIMRYPDIRKTREDYLLYNKDHMIKYIDRFISFHGRDEFCMEKADCRRKVKVKKVGILIRFFTWLNKCVPRLIVII